MSETNFLALADIETALTTVRSIVLETPLISWPLINALAGCEIWIKHENHTPIGAFKIRGGLTYMQDLASRQALPDGVISATRGNHGQSIALASRQIGLKATIVVPHGNSKEKNAAMVAFGAELIEHGDDFQDALAYAVKLADERALHVIPPFDRQLVLGVSTYAYEMFRKQPELDSVYVPIGMGSGICGVIAVRDLLGLKTKVIGVVSEGAPSYALSFAAGKPTPTNNADTMADGVACRTPNEEALDIILKGAERIVTVKDGDVRTAMSHYYRYTHNVAEGAGAIALAAVLKERPHGRDRRIGDILSGGNVDWPVYRSAVDTLADA